jgi:hypothetical protein
MTEGDAVLEESRAVDMPKNLVIPDIIYRESILVSLRINPLDQPDQD